ncbi:MAG TPA: hypothetical protein VGC15_23235 [Acetobacteraceae bacterium]
MIAELNHETFDFSKTKVISDVQQEYLGHVTSHDSNTVQGRIWIEEERTIGRSADKKTGLKFSERKRLAWSLNEWVSGLEGFVTVRGFPFTSKQGLPKHIFLTGVEKA